MLKTSVSFLLFILLLPAAGQAYFDRMLQHDLQDALTLLEDPLLEKRFAATQALLQFPDWSLPLIRYAIQNPQFQAIHWRLAYLLSVLGTQADIPLLLNATPPEDVSYQSKIWKGAAERLFWRHRQGNSQKYIISRLLFVPDDRQDDLITGKLVFKIVNPDREGRLIYPHFDLWHVRLQHPLPMPYYWIEAKSDLEVEVPLTFIALPGWKTLRIDMKVMEVGKLQGFIIHYPRKVPLPSPTSSG